MAKKKAKTKKSVKELQRKMKGGKHMMSGMPMKGKMAY